MDFWQFNPAPEKMTLAEVKAKRLIGRALAEGWPHRRFAKEAGISEKTALSYLRTYRARIIAQASAEIENDSARLANIAREARNADLRLMPRLGKLAARLTQQLESSDDLDAGELDKLAGLLAKRWKHVEALTGLDVAKQVAVRREAMKDGQPIAWDGVAEIAARPVELLPEPAPPADEVDSLLDGL